MFEETTLSTLDLVVVGGSLAVSVCIGLYFANKNKTFTDYATGGGDQNLLAVSVSMALAYCSALTLVGNSSELYLHGSSYAITMTTAIIGWPISSLILLPVFKQLNNVSIFLYLEKRYNKSLSQFASLIYILKMIFYTAITLYLPCLSLQAIMGIPQTLSIGLTGSICVICSTFGGIKGITWTNLYHSALLLLTMLIILIGGVHSAGGPQKVWTDAVESQRLLPGDGFFSFDLTTRHTIFNMLIGYLPVRIFLHGCGQNQVQSALSLSTLRRSQLSQLLSSVIYVLLQFMASACGLILYSYYKQCDPYDSGQITRRDAILMHYLSTKLHYIPAIQGLFIAAVFSATFSSVSAFQSSCSAMIIEDFVRPLFKWRKGVLSDDLGAKLGKLASFLLGLTCVALTFQMHKIEGLIQATTYIFAVFGTPILVAFMLGVTTKFANSIGVFIGMLCAIVFGVNMLTYRLAYGPSLAPSLALSVAGCNATGMTSKLISQSNVISLPIETTTEDYLDLDLDISMSLEVVEEIEIEDELPGLHQSFLLDISYLWTPAFSAIIALSMSVVCSLLTGGHMQIVDSKYLTPLIYGNNIDDKIDDVGASVVAIDPLSLGMNKTKTATKSDQSSALRLV